MAPAFLIGKTNDTVSGWIRYKGWDRLPSSIRISKDSIGSRSTNYSVDQISYLEIAHVEAYERVVIKSDSDASRSVLLRLLVKGPRLDLYAAGNDLFFIREPNGDLEKLELAPGGENTPTAALYKNKLNAYAVKYDLSELLPRIQGMNYTESELVRIVTLLNGSQGIAYTAPVFRNHPHWFVGGGVGFTGLTISGDKSYLGRIQFKNTTAPFFTAGFDYYFSKGVGPLAVRVELNYFSATYKATGLATTTDLDQIRYTLQQNDISPCAYLQYHFVNLEGFKLYAAVGVGVNLASYPQNTYQESFPQATTTTNYATLNSFWFSGNLKVGAVITRRAQVGFLSIFGNYSRETGYSFDPHTYFCWLAYRID